METTINVFNTMSTTQLWVFVGLISSIACLMFLVFRNLIHAWKWTYEEKQKDVRVIMIIFIIAICLAFVFMFSACSSPQRSYTARVLNCEIETIITTDHTQKITTLSLLEGVNSGAEINVCEIQPAGKTTPCFKNGDTVQVSRRGLKVKNLRNGNVYLSTHKIKK